ncbi:ATP-binding protein [Chryseolinea soli]|nr:ATP-binding protein [Chryseolinea soli]
MLSAPSYAQFVSVEDSLEARLPNLHGKALADAYNIIAKENVYSDLDKLDRYANKADSLSQRLGYAEGRLYSRIYKSHAVYWRGHLPEAQEQYEREYSEALVLHLSEAVYQSLGGFFIASLRQNQISKAYAAQQAGYRFARQLTDERERDHYIIEWNILSYNYDIHINAFAKARKNLEENLAYAEQHRAGHRALGLSLKTLGDCESSVNHYRSAIDYLGRALEHLRIARERHHYLATLYVLAEIYGISGEPEKAIKLYKDLAAQAERRGYKMGVAEATGSLADLYFRQGKFAQSLGLQLKAIEIYEGIQRHLKLLYARKDLGRTYMKLGDFQKAISNFKQALTHVHDPIAGETFDAVTSTYILLSQSSFLLNNRPEAFQYVRKALNVEKVGLEFPVRSLNHMANLYLQCQMPDSASLPLATLTENLARIESSEDQANYFNTLGEWRLQRIDYGPAHQAFSNALTVAGDSHYADAQLAALDGLRQVEEGRHRSEAALAYLETYSTLKDSIYSMATSNEITDIIIQYQAAEKDRKIALLKDRERLQAAELRTRGITLWLVSAVLVVAFALAVVLVRVNRINRRNSRILLDKNLEIAAQNEEIRSQTQQIELQRDRLQESVHELQHTQAMLIHAEKMASLGQLTAGVAHEINNPVNFISNGVEGLTQQIEILVAVLKGYETVITPLPSEKYAVLKGIHDERQLAETLADCEALTKSIKTGVARTTEIIKSLRTFSHEGQKGFSHVNLNEQLDATLLMTQGEMKDRFVVVKDYDPELPKVTCNIGEINQVFMNIILNAIQAMHGKGTLTVITRTQRAAGRQKIFVEIADTGPGIPRELRHKIFDPFFTTKEAGKGTGLGLAISATIIAKHHGEIRIDSNESLGTRFTIVLPATQPLATAQALQDLDG